MPRPTLDMIKIWPDEARAVIAWHKERAKHHVDHGNHDEVKRHLSRAEEFYGAMPRPTDF